jgi:hypothetical protein
VGHFKASKSLSSTEFFSQLLLSRNLVAKTFSSASDNLAASSKLIVKV